MVPQEFHCICLCLTRCVLDNRALDEFNTNDLGYLEFIFSNSASGMYPAKDPPIDHPCHVVVITRWHNNEPMLWLFLLVAVTNGRAALFIFQLHHCAWQFEKDRSFRISEGYTYTYAPMIISCFWDAYGAANVDLLSHTSQVLPVGLLTTLQHLPLGCRPCEKLWSQFLHNEPFNRFGCSFHTLWPGIRVVGVGGYTRWRYPKSAKSLMRRRSSSDNGTIGIHNTSYGKWNVWKGFWLHNCMKYSI